jgi:uncharacterized protein (DUF433 family)
LPALTRAEKAQLLRMVVQDLNDTFPGIETTPSLCGGEPCLVRTRIPVWVLEQARRLGATEEQLLRSYPALRAEDPSYNRTPPFWRLLRRSPPSSSKGIPVQGRIKHMETVRQSNPYTPAQAAAVTGLPLPAVHKAIEYRLIRPKVVREGRSLYCLLSKPQVLYLQLEANGLRCLPLAARRQIARAVEQAPNVDIVPVSQGGALVVEIKSARKQMEGALRRLAQAERMIASDPEVMRGTPVYRGTRVPVHAIADMLAQGTTVEEILEGYPGLTREGVGLAPVYAKAFPRRGRPPVRPWSRRQPRRVTENRLAS